MVEVQSAADRVSQGPVVDPQHDANAGSCLDPGRNGHLTEHESGLDIDDVVLGQDRDGPGVFGTRGGEGRPGVASPAITGMRCSVRAET